MKLRQLTAEEGLFQRALAASVLFHCGLWLAAHGLSLPSWAPSPSAEIDLTSSFLGTGPAKLGAPKKLVPEAKAPARPVDSPVVAPVVKPVEPPKDWVLPGPQTKVIEAPEAPAATSGGAADGKGTAAKVGGSGAGSDEGVPGGTGNGGAALLQLPKLLNRDEVLANLRRFYPESERRAGREGTVVVALHIGVDGKVDPVDVAASAGAAFDAAARKVAALIRFSPAVGRGGPVPVKLPQNIIFRLQD